MLGKILIICGPQSSGKSTLAVAIKEKFNNCVMLNRKKILYKVHGEITEKFFGNYLKEASFLYGKCISSLSELQQIEISNVKKENQKRFIELKTEVRLKCESPQFETESLEIVFKFYFEKIRKYIYSGFNVLIDEQLIKSEHTLSIFRRSCNYYPQIKTLLLYGDMNDLLKKAQTRNKKFVEFLTNIEDISKLNEVIENVEIKTGTSSNTYRMPKQIISSFKRFYDCKRWPNSEDVVLDRFSEKKIKKQLTNIALEQLKILQLFAEKKYNQGETGDFVDVEEEMVSFGKPHEVIQEKLEKKFTATHCQPKNFYIVPRNYYDFIIDSKSISDEKLLKNDLFLINLLRDPLKYLGIEYDLTVFQSIKVELFREWMLWSKCYGKILILNGVSCVGKSTFSFGLKKYGYKVISIDDVIGDYIFSAILDLAPREFLMASYQLTTVDFKKILFGCRYEMSEYTELQRYFMLKMTDVLSHIRDKIKFPSLEDIFKIIYGEVKKSIFSGENVVIDIVLLRNSDIENFLRNFNAYPTTMILVYDSLDKILNRCFSRNKKALFSNTLDFRLPEMVIAQFITMFTVTPCFPYNKLSLGKLNEEALTESLEKAVCHEQQIIQKIYTDDAPHKPDPNVIKQRRLDAISYFHLGKMKSSFFHSKVKFDFVCQPSTLSTEKKSDKVKKYIPVKKKQLTYIHYT